MGFLSTFQQSKLVQTVWDFLFPSNKTKPKTADEIVELWTAYRNTKPFAHLTTGSFPQPPENGFDGQEKGVYFWNQKGGPQAWLLGGIEGLGFSRMTLMASTILKKNQLCWPDWKIDAYIHKGDLKDLIVKHTDRLWQKNGHDVVYPIGKEYCVKMHDRYDDALDIDTHHLIHSVLIAKDGIHVRDEPAGFDHDTFKPHFYHKYIDDDIIHSTNFAGTARALEVAADCLCHIDPEFQAEYNEMLQKLPFEKGLKALKYCAEESLPVATIRCVIDGIYSTVEYTNPLFQDSKGLVNGERVDDSFEGHISTRLPMAFQEGTGYQEEKAAQHIFRRNQSENG